MTVPRRLVFGEVAELYDRHRLAYPLELVDDLIAESGVGEGRRALEVGAGTGKATVLFAARGIPVLAVEPSAEMAAVARRKLAGVAQVEIAQAEFERLEWAGETFGLVYSAAAWHWLDPQVRYRQARTALAPGGLLAAFWNRVEWEASDLHRELVGIYERIAPDLAPGDPMHPSRPVPDGGVDWAQDIGAADGFAAPDERTYRWSEEYTPEQYVGLLNTHSSYRLLAADRRERLLEAVRAAIAGHGGTVRLQVVTLLHTARAV